MAQAPSSHRSTCQQPSSSEAAPVLGLVGAGWLAPSLEHQPNVMHVSLIWSAHPAPAASVPPQALFLIH